MQLTADNEQLRQQLSEVLGAAEVRERGVQAEMQRHASRVAELEERMAEVMPGGRDRHVVVFGSRAAVTTPPLFRRLQAGIYFAVTPVLAKGHCCHRKSPLLVVKGEECKVVPGTDSQVQKKQRAMVRPNKACIHHCISCA